MEDSHKKFILEIFEKFIFLRSISAFIFYLLFGGGVLVRAYFGDVSFSFTQENLVFIGYAFMIISISVFFGWLIDKRIQKQKEAERQEQEELEKREQEQEETKERERRELKERETKDYIEKYINIVKNLNEYQFYIIEKMLKNNENNFEMSSLIYTPSGQIMSTDEFQKIKTHFLKIVLELKRKEIGTYNVNDTLNQITFNVHLEVWEILDKLYTKNPELFER